MTRKTWIIFILVVVVLLVALVAASRSSAPQVDVSKIDANKYQPASADNGQIADHAYAITDSKVVIIEYGDYQCPTCASVYPLLNDIGEEYKNQITLIYRNYPLTNIHPNALAAASAAEAAGLQGKYWPMHNLLYKNQSEWSLLQSDQRTNKFIEYANSLGLDTTKFKADMSSPDVAKKIAFDQALGRKESVNGTPTIFINGELIEGSVWSQIEEFKKEINKALTQNGIELPASQK